MRDRWRRHPLPIRAFFDYSLVITYAVRAEVLEPLLLPGLTVDRFGDYGFVAVALVQTRGLGPAFLPRFIGKDFFLAGYRIFTRFVAGGRRLRGLQILRSQTDSAIMTTFGNLLTRYNYKTVKVNAVRDGSQLAIDVEAPDPSGNLSVIANTTEVGELPAGSPFADWKSARAYAGPLPFTFEYDRYADAIVCIEGVRENWSPRPVAVDVRSIGFFDQPQFRDAQPILASAFYIESIPYLWKRGVLHRIEHAS